MSTDQVFVRGVLIVACLAVPAVLSYLLAQQDWGMAFVVFLFGEVSALCCAFIIASMGGKSPEERGDKPAQ